MPLVPRHLSRARPLNFGPRGRGAGRLAVRSAASLHVLQALFGSVPPATDRGVPRR
jgi:hypothetical protein